MLVQQQFPAGATLATAELELNGIGEIGPLVIRNLRRHSPSKVLCFIR